MKSLLRLVVLFIAGCLLTVLPATPLMSLPERTAQSDYIEEAKTVYALEQDYYQKRMNSDWKEIYNYQHPDFRKKVSLEEFTYFNGRLDENYWEKHPMHVCGSKSGFLEHIRKHPEQYDALGFPYPRKYKFFADTLFTMNKFSIVKISVSKDKKHAVAQYRADGRKMLPPWIIREFIVYDYSFLGADYWEKVDGRWSIAALKDTLGISGSNQQYFIPNNNEAWDKMEFVDFPVEALDPKNS